MTDPILLQQMNNQAMVNRFNVDQAADMQGRWYARWLRLRKGAEKAELNAIYDNAMDLASIKRSKENEAKRRNLDISEIVPQLRTRRLFGVNTEPSTAAPNAPEAPGILNDPLNKVRELLNNRPLGDVKEGATSAGLVVTEGGQHGAQVATNGDQVKNFIASAWEGFIGTVKLAFTEISSLFSGSKAKTIVSAAPEPASNSVPASKPVPKSGVSSAIGDLPELGNLPLQNLPKEPASKAPGQPDVASNGRE